MGIALTSRPLKVGVVLALLEDRTGPTPGWTSLVAVARRAEAVGVDSLWIPDHLLFRHPEEAPTGAWEAWSLLAALAAATTRVALGTFVLSATWRNPALLAKMAATVGSATRTTSGTSTGATNRRICRRTRRRSMPPAAWSVATRPRWSAPRG